MTTIFFNLFRVKQYSKNIFILFPVIFSGNLSFTIVVDIIIAIILFSLLASAMYIINDIKDIKYDKNHPLKHTRPIASGQVKISTAIIIASVIIITVVTISFFVFPKTAVYMLLLYLGLNFVYSFFVKKIILLDVFWLSFFYILRLYFGAVIVGVELSHWIILVTYLFALFLAFGKRKIEVDTYNTDASSISRDVIASYSVEFVTTAMGITATLAVVAYVMYTVSLEVMNFYNSKYLFVTVVFVLFGILRYFYIVSSQKSRVEPSEVVLYDVPLLLTVVLWGVSWLMIIYG